jgi:hypothetical protein
MSRVWCQAVTVIHYEHNGEARTARPGDWCELGRAQAKAELSKGGVKIMKAATLQSVQDLSDCSILTRGLVYDSQLTHLGTRYPGLPMDTYQGFPKEAGRYLIWDMGAKLNHDLILTGFSLLKGWQLAVPLLNYDTLAGNVGTPDEQAETKAIIHDLRVPVYDTRVIFARQCQETRRLFKLWDGSQLGFLRALYQARPIVNALPPRWVME